MQPNKGKTMNFDQEKLLLSIAQIAPNRYLQALLIIVLDSGDRGMVTQIGIRSTRLLTRDDVEITVPNSIMGNAKITNEAGGPHEKYSIRVKVGVAYGSDIDNVHAVLLDVANDHPEVCKTPEPRVRFRAFGDSCLDHELLCWVDRPVLRGRVLHMLNTRIYKRFIKEGIEIPFPQRDVYIKSTPPPIGSENPDRDENYPAKRPAR